MECPICKKTFDKEAVDNAAKTANILIGINEYHGVVYCSLKCVNEFRKELDSVRLKERIDELERIMEVAK